MTHSTAMNRFDLPTYALPSKPDLRGWKIGFVGIGDIGLPMVRNLLAAGAEVWVSDLRNDALAAAREAGARPGSLKELGTNCEHVGVAVINERQAREVLLAASGLSEYMKPGKTVLIHSTIPPKAVRDIAAQLQRRGLKVLDCPMSGANIAAKAGTLAFLTGGDPDLLEQCKPLLGAMGTRVFHLGEVGNGQVGKLVNGLIFHVGHVVILEALRLAEAHGVAEEDMVPLIAASTGNCWTIQNWGYFDRFFEEHTLHGNDEALVEGLLRKDIADALTAGRDARSSLPMSGLAMELYPQSVYERRARRRRR